MNFLIKFIFVLFLLIIAPALLPCTTAVVSGKVTSDGRPLLLKNRDASELQNRLIFSADGKYKFIGLVNSNDKDNKEVWVGFNNAGFGIMNSASYNLKDSGDTTKLSDQEGFLMRLALEQCGSVDDFENLLKSLPKPLGVEANFGVIDGFGGAAYFETNNYQYIKYDVNDSLIAPNGYLIRTNFSFSGRENKGYGYIRYATADQFFKDQIGEGKISFDFLINKVPRCLAHSFTRINLEENIPEFPDKDSFVYFRDYIPRYSTSAAVVVQGIRKDESPSLTTMWAILGFPLTSVAVPVWLLSDGTLPDALIADESGNSPLCNISLILKNKVFSSQNDARENYLNISKLMNLQNEGIRQKLIPVEDQVIESALLKLNSWRKLGMNESEARNFYAWIDDNVIKIISSLFNMEK